jgi:hypothetical protein
MNMNKIIQLNTAGILIDGKSYSSIRENVNVIDELTGKNNSKDWTLTQNINRNSDHLAFIFRIRAKQEAPYRSCRLQFFLPYPDKNKTSLQIWQCGHQFPYDIYFMAGSTTHYGYYNARNTAIPSVTLYDPDLDIGLTLLKAFNGKQERMSFHFGCFEEEDGISVEVQNLALLPGQEIKIEFLLHGHEGCWRPALHWIHTINREYFTPLNTDVHKLMGAFAITNPYTEKKFLDRHELKWVEIHNHFPCYGNYAPEEEEWDSVICHDHPNLAKKLKGKISVEKINKHINSLHQYGIKALLYLQCTGDGFLPWIEKKFPDSIAKDRNGHYFPTWKECCLVNSSPDTSWGQYMGKTIDRLLENYPEIDGIFLDQFCYNGLDYAHSDSHSAVDNHPVAVYAESYTSHLKKLSDRLHSQGKIIWANGIVNLELSKYIDGFMAEGLGGGTEMMKCFCLEKPFIAHIYPTNVVDTESLLQSCLLSGAGWSFGGSSSVSLAPEFTPEIKNVYAKYLPLVNVMLGAKLLLIPNPVELPGQGKPLLTKAEIFCAPDGKNILVSMVSKADRLYNPVLLKAKVPKCSSVSLLTLESEVWQDIPFVQNEIWTEVIIPEHFKACVVKFILETNSEMELTAQMAVSQ